MILVPARIMPASARVVTWSGTYTYHRVSDPVRGALPHFYVNRALPA